MTALKGLLKNIGGKVRNAAQSPVGTGLLGAAAFGFNPLLGLLAAPAIKSDRERQARSAEKSDMDIARARRQEQALGMLPGLLGPDPRGVAQRPGDMPIPLPPEMEQGRQNQLFSALMDIAPEAAVGGLLGQFFPKDTKERPNSKLQQLFAAGIDPQSDEGKQILFGSENSLQDDWLRLQIAEHLRKTSDDQAARENEAQQEEFSTQDVLRQGRELLELTRGLEGTFLQPGGVGMDVRRVGASLLGEFGGPLIGEEAAAAQRENVARLAVFGKNANDFVINMTSRFGGRVTDQQLRMLERASAGESVPPAAIKSIVTDVIRKSLRNADAKNMSIPERAEYEALLDEFQSKPSSQQEPKSGQGPQPGAVEQGFRFIGGDPAAPSSWERVGSLLDSAGDATRRGADAAGDMARRGADAAGDMARRGADAAGDMARRGADAAGDMARRGADATRNATGRGADATRNATGRGAAAVRNAARRGADATRSAVAGVDASSFNDSLQSIMDSIQSGGSSFLGQAEVEIHALAGRLPDKDERTRFIAAARKEIDSARVEAQQAGAQVEKKARDALSGARNSAKLKSAIDAVNNRLAEPITPEEIERLRKLQDRLMESLQ